MNRTSVITSLRVAAIALAVSAGVAGVSGADAAVDPDRDRLSTKLELRLGTDPMDADTDNDGVRDGEEDHDRDGVDNMNESGTGGRALDADSDDDGVADGDEDDDDDD